MAYNRPAVLLGGYHTWQGNSLLPGLAVDGNFANDIAKCARTIDSLPSDTRAWWYVDLGSTHTVTQFTLFNKLYYQYTGSAGKNKFRLVFNSDITKHRTQYICPFYCVYYFSTINLIHINANIVVNYSCLG